MVTIKQQIQQLQQLQRNQQLQQLQQLQGQPQPDTLEEIRQIQRELKQVEQLILIKKKEIAQTEYVRQIAQVLEGLVGKEYYTLKDLSLELSRIISEFGWDQTTHRVSQAPDERGLRYYITEGLIDKPVRREGTSAVYAYKHLLQALGIKHLQRLNLPLRQVKEMLKNLDEEGLKNILLKNNFGEEEIPKQQQEEGRRVLTSLKQKQFISVAELCTEVERLIPYFLTKQDRANVTDVPDERTVRYYMSMGLVDRASKYSKASGVFTYKHLLQVLVIKYLQAQNISLNEIKERVAGLGDEGVEDILFDREDDALLRLSSAMPWLNIQAYLRMQQEEKTEEINTEWLRIKVSDDIELNVNTGALPGDAKERRLLIEKLKGAVFKNIKPLL